MCSAGGVAIENGPDQESKWLAEYLANGFLAVSMSPSIINPLLSHFQSSTYTRAINRDNIAFQFEAYKPPSFFCSFEIVPSKRPGL